MKSGRLRWRLLLYRPRVQTTVTGSRHAAWEDAGAALAERAAVNPSTTVEVGEQWAEYLTTYNVRSSAPVREGWRLREAPDGMLMEVATVVAMPRRGLKQLRCCRVNP